MAVGDGLNLGVSGHIKGFEAKVHIEIRWVEKRPQD